MDFNLTQVPVFFEFELEFNVTIIDDDITERRETVFFGIELEQTETVISPDPVEVVIFDNDPGTDIFVCKMFVLEIFIVSDNLTLVQLVFDDYENIYSPSNPKFRLIGSNATHHVHRTGYQPCILQFSIQC